MKSREDETEEIEEVIEEIDSSVNTSEYLADQMRSDEAYSPDRKAYSYFRRGISHSFINFGIVYNLIFVI